MFHLTIAVIWILVFFAFAAYRPHASLERAAQVETGCWVALFLAGYNLVRGGLRLVLTRRRKVRPSEPPPRPVVNPEFRVDDSNASDEASGGP